MTRSVLWRRLAVRLADAFESGESMDEKWNRRVMRAIGSIRFATRSEDKQDRKPKKKPKHPRRFNRDAIDSMIEELKES